MSGEIIVASRAETHKVQSHGVTIVAKWHRQKLTHLPPSFIKEYAQYRVKYWLNGEPYIMSQTKLWGENFFLAAVEQVWRLLLLSSCCVTFLTDLKNKTRKTTVTHSDELLLTITGPSFNGFGQEGSSHADTDEVDGHLMSRHWRTLRIYSAVLRHKYFVRFEVFTSKAISEEWLLCQSVITDALLHI